MSNNLTKSRLYVALSKIHGNGLFTREFVHANVRLFLVADLGLRNQSKEWITPLGGMVNHSVNGNTYLYQQGNYFYLCGLRDIGAGEELTSDYTKAPPYFSRDVTGFK